MKLEFSIKEIKKMIRKYYLDKEEVKVKVNIDVERNPYLLEDTNYYFTGNSSFRKKENGLVYDGKIKINKEVIIQILDYYLTPEGYEIDDIYPLMETKYSAYEHLAGVEVYCHKIEKKDNKKLVRKQ